MLSNELQRRVNCRGLYVSHKNYMYPETGHGDSEITTMPIRQLVVRLETFVVVVEDSAEEPEGNAEKCREGGANYCTF